MYMSNRIGKLTSTRPPPRKRSLDDIDELTYMLMLGTKAGGRKSSNISSIMKRLTLSENKWLPETEALPEHVEVHHRQAVLDEDREEEESTECSSAESVEQTSEVSIPDKIRCIKFANLEFFAEMFVDEIIDISVDVCENLFNAALSGEDDVVTEVPCICDAPKPPEKIKPGPSDSSSLSSVEKKEFSGWPTIKHFTVGGAKKKIMEFMGQWYFVEDWKYTVHYIGSYSDSISDYHLYQGMWSIPTKEYPIAQATAAIFFSIEVSRVKPKFCLVDVTLQFEGSSSVYRAGQFEFIEHWLFNIIDSKLNLFRTLRF